MDEQLVTIGVPVFNGEETIASALDSLLAQGHKNLEIIISDNASTDGTREICERYAASDPRIIYHRNEENIGVIPNFNKLVFMGNGPYFMWAAVDDRWEPEFIAELVRLHERFDGVVCTFCRFDLVDRKTDDRVEGPDLVSVSRLRTPFQRSAKFLLMPEPYHKATLIYGIFETDFIRRIGGIYSGYRGGSWSLDNHTLLAMSLQGSFAVSDRLLFHKGFISGTVNEISHLPTFREMHLSFLGYLDQIENSDIEGAGRFVLRSLAVVNHAMNIIGKIVISALVESRLDQYTKRLYRKLLH